MLHREQGRRRAGRDPDLAVGVLDVAVGGLDRDPETLGDLLGLEAAGEHAEDLGLALGQPGWALQSRHPLPGRLDHGGDRVGVKAAGARLASQVLGRPFRRHRLPVRPLSEAAAELFREAGVVCEVSDDPIGVEHTGVAKNAAAVAVGAWVLMRWSAKAPATPTVTPFL